MCASTFEKTAAVAPAAISMRSRSSSRRACIRRRSNGSVRFVALWKRYIFGRAVLDVIWSYQTSFFRKVPCVQDRKGRDSVDDAFGPNPAPCSSLIWQASTRAHFYSQQALFTHIAVRILQADSIISKLVAAPRPTNCFVAPRARNCSACSRKRDVHRHRPKIVTFTHGCGVMFDGAFSGASLSSVFSLFIEVMQQRHFRFGHGRDGRRY